MFHEFDHKHQFHFNFRSWNIDCELLNPQQIKKICPFIHIQDLKGGLWIPKDGTVDPFKICQVLFNIAKSKGNELLTSNE